MMRSHGTDAPREIYQFGKKGEKIYDAIEKAITLVTHCCRTFIRPPGMLLPINPP